MKMLFLQDISQLSDQRPNFHLVNQCAIYYQPRGSNEYLHEFLPPVQAGFSSLFLELSQLYLPAN